MEALSCGIQHSLTALSIVFIHGLRGHPRKTWATADVDDVRRTKTEKADSFRSLFKQRTAKSAQASGKNAPSSSSSQLPFSDVFWPEDYLVSDVPNARIWTYGYNADVMGGLFQANNKNSVSQHGRDLSVKLEREVANGVG